MIATLKTLHHRITALEKQAPCIPATALTGVVFSRNRRAALEREERNRRVALEEEEVRLAEMVAEFQRQMQLLEHEEALLMRHLEENRDDHDDEMEQGIINLQQIVNELGDVLGGMRKLLTHVK